MEIDITEFFNSEDPGQFSANALELGHDAGKITWRNALRESEHYMFVNESNREQFIDYFDGFGAWDDLADWPNQELNALFIQDVSSAMREFHDLADGDWDEWGKLCEKGTVMGSLFNDFDGRVYFYIGN